MSLATEIWGLIRTNLNQQIAAAKALFDDVQVERQELTTIRDSAVTARDEAQAAVSDAANAARTEVARVVDGAPEDLDTIREVAEYAQSNRDITDQLNAAIGDKANKTHTHTQAQVTGLSTALNGKANASHTHTTSQVTGLDTALNGKADASHTHSQSQVTGLTTALNGKANTSHTHTTSQVSGLSTALSKKADKAYVNSRPALFSGSGAPPSSIAGAVVGDFWLDTSTMTLHKITGV